MCACIVVSSWIVQMFPPTARKRQAIDARTAAKRHQNVAQAAAERRPAAKRCTSGSRVARGRPRAARELRPSNARERHASDAESNGGGGQLVAPRSSASAAGRAPKPPVQRNPTCESAPRSRKALATRGPVLVASRARPPMVDASRGY